MVVEGGGAGGLISRETTIEKQTSKKKQIKQKDIKQKEDTVFQQQKEDTIFEKNLIKNTTEAQRTAS